MTTAEPRQEAQLVQWLELAPKPPALQRGWHVFLSYRSVNRSWVLHLYDALRSVGFDVFLDQLEIAAGDSLVSRLNNALENSQTGVIVWSTRYEDSEWCRAEYESMEALRRDKSRNFRFVVIKLKDAELPSLAAKDVYLDFSEYPSGPQGGELLRLMYGLLGQAIPAPVLLAAQSIDDQTKLSLTRIRAARSVGNAKALVDGAAQGGSAWQASPLLYCSTAEALIEIEKEDAALSVLETAKQFEKAIRPIQLRALAFARKAKRAMAAAQDDQRPAAERSHSRDQADSLIADAQQMLAELYELNHRDPETLGLYARTWMDRYALTGSRIFLEKSRDLYAHAFGLHPTDYYTGINAAAKSVLLDELTQGAELAKRVELIVGAQPVPGDYWKCATVAEAQLIQSAFDRAAELYRKAVSDAPTATGNHASTLTQAERLMAHLKPPEAQRQKILSALRI